MSTRVLFSQSVFTNKKLFIKRCKILLAWYAHVWFSRETIEKGSRVLLECGKNQIDCHPHNISLTTSSFLKFSLSYGNEVKYHWIRINYRIYEKKSHYKWHSGVAFDMVLLNESWLRIGKIYNHWDVYFQYNYINVTVRRKSKPSALYYSKAWIFLSVGTMRMRSRLNFFLFGHSIGLLE